MDAEHSLEARDAVLRTARELIGADSRAARAYAAMTRGGFTPAGSEAEIALILMGAIWETSRGLPDRFADLCDGLAKGLTVEQLLAESLQDSRRTQRAYRGRGANVLQLSDADVAGVAAVGSHR
jgi:hypothetical protein